MLERFFKSKNKEDKFWVWFSEKANVYYHFEQNQAKLFSDLKSELEKIHPGIVFEFSPILRDGKREFIISADGIKSIFPCVNKLVNKAPTLKNWRIVAFRQPHNDITKIHFQDLVINLTDVFFRYTRDNGKIGIELNIKGLYESSQWTAAIFILLDTILGEYATEMYIGYIDKKELNEKEINGLFPIKSLPKIIQDYQSELNN